MRTKFFAIIAFILMSFSISAQSCNWTICLYDTYGDGWDLADVEVLLNGTSLGYAWLNYSDYYGPVCYSIPVTDGDTMDIIYTAGWWPSENWYALYDGDGNLFYVSNNPPDDYQTVVTCSTSVPIELKSFEYSCEESSLFWTTSSETNNDYFTIEKSFDTKEWKIADKITGHGNSNIEQNYQSTISENGIYYRLCQHDYDGTIVCYDVIYVDCAALDDIIFKVYPVPVNRNEYLNICCDNIESLRVVNMLGQEVQYERMFNAIKISTPGTYLITINDKETKKIIVH